MIIKPIGKGGNDSTVVVQTNYNKFRQKLEKNNLYVGKKRRKETNFEIHKWIYTINVLELDKNNIY